MKYKLTDVAAVIRSKNSGPYELTFDVMFKDAEFFTKFVDADVFTPKVFANLYGIDEDSVLSVIAYPPALAVKATIKRPMPSGALGERDVYGAQQHRPLMGFEFEV